jgi:diguanylate cyclase (GGDEF)-like protein
MEDGNEALEESPQMELDEGNNELLPKAIEAANLISYTDFLKRKLNAVKEGSLSTEDLSMQLARLDQAKNNLLGEYRDSMRENENLALKDPLTGLPNRRWFENQLEVVLAQAATGEKDGIYLLELDLDEFKGINGAFGHPVGDEIIKSVAKLSRKDEPIARIGGEEFVQLVDISSMRKQSELTDEEILSSLAGRYGKVLEETTQPILDAATPIIEVSDEARRRRATFSIGATKVLPNDTQESLMERVNGGLHEAKNTGRDKLVLVGLETPTQELAA